MDLLKLQKMKQETEQNLHLLIDESWLKPTLNRLMVGIICSALVHGAGYLVFRYAPLVKVAVGFGQIEFVDEAYNRGILIDLSKPLRYPGDYPGFTAPTKTVDLEKLKEAEKKRKLEEEKQRAEQEAKELALKDVKNKSASENKVSDVTPTPAPKPTPSGFKPINTRPIRDQIQQLYDLKKDGKLVFDEFNLRVGVRGDIKPDGTIENFKVFIPSGNPQIDRAAIAIIEAVSESHALGPLSTLTSLSMVLTVDDKYAQLVTVGFAPNTDTAAQLHFLAKAAVDFGKKLKAADPASMIFLNNIKVTQSGNRLTATITVPSQVARETLSKTMINKTLN